MSPKSPVQSLQGPGVGVSGVLVDLVDLLPAVLLTAFFIGLWFWRRDNGGCVLPAVVPLITASEVSSKIAEVVRNIVLSIFEILSPIINILGIAQIIIGLMLALGLRQEFLGWRLIATGIIMLIFVHVIAPFLLQFI
jgi:hypothetical protein